MASKSIGYGKTYDWTKGACVNLQHTEITTPTAQDGYLMLGFGAVTTDLDPWDLTGWTESNGGAGSDSSVTDGILYQVTGSTNGNYSSVEKASYYNGGSSWTNFTVARLVKMSSYDTHTDTATSGGMIWQHGDGTLAHKVAIRSDGTNVDIYSHTAAGSSTRYDTSVPASTSVWRVMELDGTGSANSDNFSINGTVVGTSLKTYSYGAGAGYAENIVYKGTAIPACYTRWTKFFAARTRYNTSDGTWTSTYDDAIFDAGAGRRWSKVDFTAIVENSTVVTVEIRCATTSGGLAAASYETIAASGDSIVSKGRFIQVKLTLADASSGQYTPIMQDITVTDEVDPVGGNHIQYSFFHLW